MPDYRRANVKGGTYFFTVVTYQRQPILVKKESRLILRQAIEHARKQHPFKIDAWILLPDHLHCIWKMPYDDHNFSKRWGIIKAYFSKRTRALFHKTELVSPSRNKHRETTIWQRRFWEHKIKDDIDYQNHMDYIHYNSVKHGLVTNANDWPFSSFHRYVQQGVYPKDWGSDINLQVNNAMYGE